MSRPGLRVGVAGALGLGPARARRWGSDPGRPGRGMPPRGLVVALVLACATLMVLDRGPGESPVDAARSVVGEALSPAQSVTTAVTRPLLELPEAFRGRGEMRAELASLREENADLRTQVRRSGFDRNRLAELEGLLTTAEQLGYALVPARVVGLGAAASFNQTVTVDAGRASGIAPDMTVVSADGLVGRVLRVTDSTATVLLLADSGSVVGGRIGESMDMGFLRGRGELGQAARLDLELVDQQTLPREGETVVTWGSEGSGPYVAGVPIGRVESVFASLRDSSQRVVIDPYVDFAALDVVAVVVPSGTRSDRPVVEADGSVR